MIAGAASTPVPAPSFDALNGERTLKERLKVADLGAFGGFTRAELAAIGALLTYVDLTQLGRQPSLRPPRRSGPEATLVIDAASRASLELVRASSGEKDGSLLGAMDLTVTAPGARELAARIASPLKSAAEINARLDAVGFLVEHEILRDRLRGELRTAPDIARAIALAARWPARPEVDRPGPRRGGDGGPLLADQAMGLPDILATTAKRLQGVPPTIAAELGKALVDEPPHLKRDGGFVAEGYRTEIDKARARRRQPQGTGRAGSALCRGDRRQDPESPHNHMLGYFVEVTQANARPLQTAPTTRCSGTSRPWPTPCASRPQS